MKILIIEDEPDLAEGIAEGLRCDGYIADISHDGMEGLQQLRINSYDLAVLDLNLPSMDGFSILKTARAEGNDTPILILSARSAVEDKIEGLDLGANDYLAKPFHFGELSARVRSLLRTSFLHNSNLLEFASLQMDILKHTVTVKEELLQLTPREYLLLEYLLLNQSIPVSAEKLIEHTADSDDSLFSNSIKVHISCLRKKITTIDENIAIVNIRGAGYLLKEARNED